LKSVVKITAKDLSVYALLRFTLPVSFWVKGEPNENVLMLLGLQKLLYETDTKRL
jgi:hypothetical protein